MFCEVPLTGLVSALLHIGKWSHGPVGGRGETARSCLLTLFIAAHCTPQSLHVVYTQCRGGPLPSATRNTYECIKQHFLLIPPFRNILLGETLYLDLDSCTRSAPAMLTWAWELGVLYCAYCSYGDMAIGVTDNGQVMAALSWPLHVYVYS